MRVLNGIDVLLATRRDLIRKARLALFTNRSGVTQDLRENYVALKEQGFNLKFIMTPEHGLFGAFQAGEDVKNEQIEPLTGLPVVSTYKNPQAFEKLSDVDIVLYDIQDVGLRFYTYVSSLKLLMENLNGKKLIVLDRVNPLGRKVEGGIVKDGYFSFVGALPIPVRHGMTIGEIASFIKDRYNLDIDLEVVKVKGWNGEDITQIDGYPFVPPSPAINSIETIFYYMLTVFFEGSNVSEGRGTYRPFRIFGAPFFTLKDFKLLEEMFNGDYRFMPVQFIPATSKHKGQLCNGFEIYPRISLARFSVYDGIILFLAVKNIYEEDFELLEFDGKFFIDLLTGSSDVRLQEKSFIEKWKSEALSFLDEREAYLLY